jgi:hypothetical protein
VASEQDLTIRRLAQAAEQAHERRLPRPVRADERGERTLQQTKRRPAHDFGQPRAVAEVEIARLD